MSFVSTWCGLRSSSDRRYSSSWNLAITYQGMVDCFGSYRKITLHIDFKLRFHDKTWIQFLVLIFWFFSFNLVWFESFACQGYSSNLRMTILKQWMTDWSRSNEKMTSDSKWVFAVGLIQIDTFSFNFVWFHTFGCHGYSSNWTLAIVKQEILGCLGNKEKIKSHSHLKLTSSDRSWDVERSYFYK